MRKRHFWLVLTILGFIGVLLVLPFVAFVPSNSNRLPVDEEALQRTREVLASIQQNPINSQSPEIATNFSECNGILRELLFSNKNQYTLTVVAAFDPNDPHFLPAGIKYVNGSRDAAVAVRFPDESEVELYFYGGFYEGCRVTQTYESPITISTEAK